MTDIIRLLYAEDNPQDADLTRTHFERAASDFSLEIVGSGTACLARLSEQPFDMLLLDNRLPDMNGIDVLGKLRADGHTLPVVLVTGVGDEETVAKALRAGAADYVSKSEEDYLVTLPDLLRQVLARQRGRNRESDDEQRIQKILYVEPNAMDVELTTHHLEIAAPHLQLHIVTTSRDALALLSGKHDFNLVLTDLRVPDMNALELIREIQHRGIDLPFVVITGKGDEATAVAILRLGAYDYLVKRKNYLVQLPHAIDHALQRFHLDRTTRYLNAELVTLNATLEENVRARTEEIRATKNKLQATLDAIPDPLFEVDLEGRYYDYHSPRTDFLEAPPETLLGKRVADVMPPGAAEICLSALREANETGRSLGRQFELPLSQGNFWFELSVSRKADEPGIGPRFIVLSRDITSRKLDEAKILQLSQLYAALSQCNQAIVRCTSEDELFRQICNDVVTFGGIKMAWIGLTDQQTGRVDCVAAFGTGTDYLEGIRITVDANDPYGRGPVGISIRENKPVWCQDFQNDPLTKPWHGRAALVGWGAIASLPLCRSGRAIGAFVLYATMTNFFDEATRKLLIEMADDISFALDNFEREAARKQVENALRSSEKSLLDAQQVGSIGSYISELSADVWRSSETLDDILGIGADYPRTTAGWMALIHPVHRVAMRSFLDSLIAEHQTIENEFRIVRANDGAERWVMVRGRTEYDSKDHPLHVTGIIQDITLRKESEAQLELAAKVFEQSGEGFLITDANRNIIRVNQAFTTISGYGEADVLGQNPRMLASGKQDKNFFSAMWESIDTLGHWQGEILDRRKDGSLYSKWLSISRVRDAQGKVTHYVGIFNDITQQKQDEEHIQRLAHFDALTGLPNRVLLNDRISHALSMAQRNQTQLAVLFLDLDHFKNVNDSLGHRIGDELLVQVAARLSEAIREEDTVSRLGGDEFILVLQDSDADGAAHVSEKLIESIARPYRIEHHDLVITPSIGIAMFPTDGEDFESLSKCADVAMYRAKNDGRNNFRFFTTEMQANSTRRLKLENALRNAQERNQLSLHYQPQMSLASGLIIGAEALLRWSHPEFGMVSPAEFIPIAEDSGLILSIGEWVLRTAINQMKIWIDGGMNAMVIAVNLSAVQFRNPKLPALVTQILDEAQLPPQYLELELTEGVAMDDPLGAIAIMDDLHDRGVRMSIDDFGTGYSSLSYLKRFKVYKLKIDQSFVSDLTEDPEDKAIVKAIINLASSLGLQTIAEGVETEGQLAFLNEQGCNEMQGYHLSKPLPAEQFVAFMREKSQV